MKYTLVLSMFVLCGLSAWSQKQESFYVFDANWKPTKIETAKYFLHTQQLSDTCWQWDFYHFTGPMIKSERFKDKNGEVFHGVSYHYNEKGRLDSMSEFSNGKKDGESWKAYGDSLKHRL